LAEELRAYITAAGIAEERKGWLFRTAKGWKATVLAQQAMSQADAWRMIRRRAKAAGIKAPIGCHTFRGTGITAYLDNGGTLDHAQAMCSPIGCELRRRVCPRGALIDREVALPSFNLWKAVMPLSSPAWEQPRS
jgi:integrase